MVAPEALKTHFPSPAVRARFYVILLQILDERPSHAPAIPLQELSRQCSIPLGEVTSQAKEVAYLLCYGLYRGKAFRFYKTDHAFNPDIIGLGVEPNMLDECTVNNIRASFLCDSQLHGLPLDERVLAQLMLGSANSEVPNALPAQPAMAGTEAQEPQQHASSLASPA